MMWFLLLLYIAHTELVFIHAQGGVHLILKGEEGPCKGHAEIYYKNQWGYVGDKFWDDATNQVVCRSTHCGEPVTAAENKDVHRRAGMKVWLNEVKCNGSENHLWNCKYPGWNVSKYRKATVKKIECSRKINITLDGFGCAGAVQYHIKGEEQTGYFCADKWEKKQADTLCNSLKCGIARKTTVHEWMTWKKFKESRKMMINCPDNKPLEHLWHCVTQESPTCENPVSVECEGHKRLQLKGNTSNVCSGQLEKEDKSKWSPETESKIGPADLCKQMHCGNNGSFDDNSTQLTCSDNISVSLVDGGKSSQCYGLVHINVNGKPQSVCGSNWDKSAAAVVCKELNCGTVISHSARQFTTPGIMDNVDCLGGEASLWHCRAKHDDTLTCSSSAYVVCSGSVSVRLKDGPGKCTGRVEILHEGKWKQVYDNNWKKDNTDTVCRQLKCGQGRKSEPFSQGSSDFLANVVECKSNAPNISECFTAQTHNSTNKKAVGITCEEHKMVFLKSDEEKACSGMVGIEHGENTYWLSGSEQTWDNVSANIVCQQMHCGFASSFSSYKPTADANMSVLSYSCSSKNKSLFDCQTKEQSSGNNETIATVDCSGNIKINLTNKCWGIVNICLEGKCGHMCADSWTEHNSVELCNSLGCGDKVLPAINQPSVSDVMIKSFHKTKQTTNLTQCNFVLADEKDKKHKPAYVVCSGSVKPKFSVSRDKCLGNVEVFYDGNWLPVCTDALQEEAQHSICEELECGKAVNKITYFGPKPEGGHMISQLQCPTAGIKSLAACNFTTQSQPCTPTGLQCTNWRTLEVSNTCHGAVSVYSNGNDSAVSIKGWTEKEGDKLCQYLKCGSYKANNIHRTSENLSFWDRSFNCTSDKTLESIWDCEKQTKPSVEEQLSIECQGNQPNVTISKKCHGTVRINGMEVCNSHWKTDYSDLLCQEQNCSNAIEGTHTSLANPTKKYQHVSCHDNHYKLGQCNRVEGKCNEGLVSVYCVDNVKFRTTETCGGHLEVDYGKGSKKVCPLASSQQFKTKLCQELGCNGHNKSIKDTGKKKESLEVTLNCSSDHNDVKHCVVLKTCREVPAEIYCNGYVTKNVDTGPASGLPMGRIILGVGLFLVLVILVIIFVRIYMVRKDKKALYNSSRMMSSKEVEFESGDYEDVMNKANEMEDFSRGGFRSEAEFITENDARSTSSFPYDDIDEALEAQPLTSQAAIADSSPDIKEVPLNQNGVTYEVDDPQESYDDIEASPDLTQTKAEVHNSPKTTPESDTVAAPGLVQEDVDYIVPGEDG